MGARAMPVVWVPWRRGSVRRQGRDVVVSVTVFEVHRYRDVLAVARNGLRIRRGWPDVEGSTGLYLWAKPLARMVGSVSVWDSEEHLRRWLRTPGHVDLVRRFRPRMKGSSVKWDAGRARVSPSYAWDEGQRRLADSRA